MDTSQLELTHHRERLVKIQLDLDVSREDVRMWVDAVKRACADEYINLGKENGDIADGDLQTTWNLLQESIKEFRALQDRVSTRKMVIADIESDME